MKAKGSASKARYLGMETLDCRQRAGGMPVTNGNRASHRDAATGSRARPTPRFASARGVDEDPHPVFPVAHGLRPGVDGGRAMSNPEIAAHPVPAATLPPLSLPARACLAIVQPFIDGPLRRFNARLRPVGQRYESEESYEADRLESMDEYLG